MNDVTVEVIGLEDPDGDLILEARCNTCGVRVWRRTYKAEEMLGLTRGEIFAQTKRDVMIDQARIAQHVCVTH